MTAAIHGLVCALTTLSDRREDSHADHPMPSRPRGLVGLRSWPPPHGAAPCPRCRPASARRRAATLTSLVNPFIGTQNFGNTFPGASAPFGMVQVSPDTGGQGGYDYSAVQDLRLQPDAPVRSRLRRDGRAADHADHRRRHHRRLHDSYSSAFSHDDETATPGYYRVGLHRYGINAELTATDRTGWQRYTFPSGSAAQRHVQHRPREHAACSTRSHRRQRPHARGHGARRRLLRRPRPAHRLLHRAVRQAVRVIRHVDRLDASRRGRAPSPTAAGNRGAWVTLRPVGRQPGHARRWG